MARTKHKSLTIEDVKTLGATLIEVADLYPLQFRTERDFFPLVLAYLNGRVPSVETETGTTNGTIDFRIGGPNPAVLELAVAPRALIDPNNPTQQFPGHKAATQLYATQNKTELKKLKGVPQSQARNRYLLLLDLWGKHDYSSLQEGYEKALAPGGGGECVRGIYVKRGNVAKDFRLGGKKKKARN